MCLVLHSLQYSIFIITHFVREIASLSSIFIIQYSAQSKYHILPKTLMGFDSAQPYKFFGLTQLSRLNPLSH
jgi:hypothetical protein